MPPSTIPSTSSAISSPGRRFGSSDRRRRRNGAARPPRHDDSPRPGISARTPQLDSALVAPFHVLGRDRIAVVKLEPRAEPKCRALATLGRIIAFGQSRVVVMHLAKIFDQRVVQRHDEIVGACRAVVLLWVE